MTTNTRKTREIDDKYVPIKHVNKNFERTNDFQIGQIRCLYDGKKNKQKYATSPDQKKTQKITTYDRTA